MGHHLDSEGRFQSDKYPELSPDKIILSFHDQLARQSLRYYAKYTDDKELADDILCRVGELDAMDCPKLAKQTNHATALLKVIAPPSGCSSCMETIYWIVTKNGKRAPYNPDGTSHFATCPNADAHRKG